MAISCKDIETLWNQYSEENYKNGTSIAQYFESKVSESLSNMEREQYQNQIKDFFQAVETLLKSNNAIGEELRKTSAAHEDLKAKYEKQESRLAMHKRSTAKKQKGIMNSLLRKH